MDDCSPMMRRILEQLGIAPDREMWLESLKEYMAETANDLRKMYSGRGMTEEELREYYANHPKFKHASVVVFHISQEDAFK